MTHREDGSPDPGANDPLMEEAKGAAVGDGGSSVPDGIPTETLTDSPSRLPKRIGQYHIKRVIASGGMGTVYEAVQEKPRRPVALKLMKQGIASRSALRRFEYESQILARLRHPGIAQVYDAGTHKDDSGTTPYFAMEYIPNALPITKYVKEKKLGTRERMALFAQVCEAVHHGHQKGIIHRDLKPSNILVDAHGQVKIIDFGVARSTDSDLAVTTLQTDVGQLIGTLQYMSPEQCAADPHDIDTRSDVYALGVVFYELLTEHLPYDVRKKAVFEATRVIREEQPTRLSTINRTLRGDVETIALKALEKERDRRYQSATDFGQDIRRFLSNEAITARRASMMYQFRVLVRRNKPIFAAIAVVFVVLVGATAVSTTLYFHSQREARKSETTLEFLQDMLASVDPGRAMGREVTVRSMLDETVRRIDAGELSSQPAMEASIRTTTGKTYSSLGHYADAESQLRKAEAIRKRELGDEHRDTLRTRMMLGEALWRQYKNEEAERVLRLTVNGQRRVLGEEHPETLRSMWSLAAPIGYQRRFEESEKLYRRTLAAQQRVLGEDHVDTLTSLNSLGVALAQQNRHADAELVYRRAVDLLGAALGPTHPKTLVAMNNLGDALCDQGKYSEAEPLMRSAVEVHRRVFGATHPKTFMTEQNLCRALAGQGKFVEAEALARDTLDAMRRVLGAEHRDTMNTLDGLIGILVQQGKTEEARPYVAELIGLLKRTAERPDAGAADLNAYAMLLLTCELQDLRDPQTAVAVAKRAVERSSETLAPYTLDTLALACFMTGDVAKAVETQEKAVSFIPPGESGLRTGLEANLAKYRAALAEQNNPGPHQPTSKEQP